MLHHLHISELQHRLAAFDDQHAFRELFLRFQPMLKRFAFSICHQAEASEEVVSDVFIRVWQKRKTLDHIQNLKLYLYVATRNYALNYLRSQKNQPALQIEDIALEVEAMAPNPEQAMYVTDLQASLYQAINQLPAQCRLIFKLVKEDGLKHKEVAELMHLQPKTVENQIAIAVRKIAQHIGAQKPVQQQAASKPGEQLS